MAKTTKRRLSLAHAGRAVVPLLLVAVVAALAVPAAAAPQPRSSCCRAPARPRASPPAAAPRSTPVICSRGDIFRGDVQRGTAELFIDAPAGRMAAGMAVDLAHDLLFVAGGFTGQGYVYDTRTGATVATYQFGPPAPRSSTTWP